MMLRSRRKKKKTDKREEIRQLFVNKYQEYTGISTQIQFIYNYGKMPKVNSDKVFSFASLGMQDFAQK